MNRFSSRNILEGMFTETHKGCEMCKLEITFSFLFLAIAKFLNIRHSYGAIYDTVIMCLVDSAATNFEESYTL